MPIFINPRLRALQDAQQSFGIIAVLDSTGFTDLKALETAGTVLKVVPLETYYYGNSTYTPHS